MAYWRNCDTPRWLIGASNTRQPPAPAQPAADGMQRAAGPSCGMLPNIHVRSISTETLRADPHFAALPPVDDLVLSHPQCYRCLRSHHLALRAAAVPVVHAAVLQVLGQIRLALRAAAVLAVRMCCR